MKKSRFPNTHTSPAVAQAGHRGLRRMLAASLTVLLGLAAILGVQTAHPDSGPAALGFTEAAFTDTEVATSAASAADMRSETVTNLRCGLTAFDGVPRDHSWTFTWDQPPGPTPDGYHISWRFQNTILPEDGSLNRRAGEFEIGNPDIRRFMIGEFWLTGNDVYFPGFLWVYYSLEVTITAQYGEHWRSQEITARAQRTGIAVSNENCTVR